MLTSSLLPSLAFASLEGEPDLSRYTYDDYTREFGIRYSAGNDTVRKSIFDRNLDSIRTHNSDPSKTWFMTVNEFTELSADEFKSSHLGLMPDIDDSAFVGEFFASSTEGLPHSVDWRTKPGVMTPVKNQGHCGSCWAFAVTETLESHYAISNQHHAPILSAQQVTSCAGGAHGCNGGTEPLGFKYTAHAGITTDQNYPYTARTGRCDHGKIKPCVKNDGHIKLRHNDYNSLITAVASKGPIAISVAAGKLQSYGGGIFSAHDCDVDHAVQLVGYGTSRGREYWLVRNSWGPSWGEKGYFRVRRYGHGKEPKCGAHAGVIAILSQSSYPVGVKKVGHCASAAESSDEVVV